MYKQTVYILYSTLYHRLMTSISIYHILVCVSTRNSGPGNTVAIPIGTSQGHYTFTLPIVSFFLSLFLFILRKLYQRLSPVTCTVLGVLPFGPGDLMGSTPCLEFFFFPFLPMMQLSSFVLNSVLLMPDLEP
jgi:hypothetical protein